MKRAASSRVRQAVQLTTLIAVFALLGVRATGAQNRSGATLTNADVVQMVKAGKSDSEIIAAIHSGNAKFDLTEKQLVVMHNEGVSSAVLRAMYVRAGGAAAGQRELKTQIEKAPLAPQKSIRMAGKPRATNAGAAILALLQKQRSAADAEIAQTKLRIQKQRNVDLLSGPSQPKSAAGARGSVALLGNAQNGAASDAGSRSATTGLPQNNRIGQAPAATMQKPATGSIGPERTANATLNPSGGSGLLAQNGNRAVQNTPLVNANNGANGGSGSPAKNGISSRISHLPTPVDSTA